MSAFDAGMVTATVHPRDWTAKDRLGNHIEAYKDPVTTKVLVAIGATSDLDASRPEGTRVDLTLHFPKSWTDMASLHGAKVELQGPWAGTYKVVGRPMPYAPQLVPIDLYMAVEVVSYDG